MTEPLLELRGLSGGYPPVSVFRNVDLKVHAGEHVGFFGPNGHGKTTLLKTIAGLIDPWDGGIYFEGTRLNAKGAMAARTSQNLNYDLFRKRRIKAQDVVDAGLIYVMQGNLLFPEMTVEEVLDIAPRAAERTAGRRSDARPDQRPVPTPERALDIQDPLSIRRGATDGQHRRRTFSNAPPAYAG